MTNKMDGETGPQVLNMSEYFFVPNFELRPMFSAKNLEKFDIFKEGQPKLLENTDLDKLANYVEFRLNQEWRDKNLKQVRYRTAMTYCKTEDFISQGIEILSAYQGMVLCPDFNKLRDYWQLKGMYTSFERDRFIAGIYKCN